MAYAYPQYWRDMVKHGLNCTDEYADILLKYAETHSNGIDTSEAEWDELDAYWKEMDLEYKDELRIEKNSAYEDIEQRKVFETTHDKIRQNLSNNVYMGEIED